MYQKYKANESTSKHNPKKKRKQPINKKIRKKSFANRTHGYEMTINITKKTQYEKIVICHNLTNDEGALAIMCGGDENPHQVQQPAEKLLWTHKCLIIILLIS
jgi:hypothetical protein